MRAIFFDADDAQAVIARLRADGFEARAERERLAGEDDDEDHPWAVVTDAPDFMLEVLVDTHDGWLDEDDGTGTIRARNRAPRSRRCTCRWRRSGSSAQT